MKSFMELCVILSIGALIWLATYSVDQHKSIIEILALHTTILESQTKSHTSIVSLLENILSFMNDLLHHLTKQ